MLPVSVGPRSPTPGVSPRRPGFSPLRQTYRGYRRTWVRKSVAARTVAMENAVRVVDLALRAVGGASYFKRFPLERYYRDVRAALFHPVSTDQTLELLGKTAFGIPLMDDDVIWA
ncbi:MAG: acyl-CoA/acyl-ACP dehydrogenase [Desulfurellaceae bacterium]|nr:acyl-CoA/acyl-ACP dehydrogenase [Desulfurellaceae bacterium]